MMYEQYRPPPPLEKYIDAYWSVKTTGDHKPALQRILPDTCADIIINLGSAVTAENDGKTVMMHEKTYLVGTMTQYCDTLLSADALLVGIRFKPFALHSLLGIALNGAADKTVELGSSEFEFKKLLVSKKTHSLQNTIDTFFINRLHTRDEFLLQVVESINQAKGVITVQALAKKHFITERQLERICKLKTGITIKELCKQIRFNATLQMLKQRGKNLSIDDIACDTGFYDHSHLAKEIKKYTGRNPGYYNG